LYAWSTFRAEVNEWGTVTKWIHTGEEISQSDIGVSDEEWKELQDLGVVRDEPYPNASNDQSPQEFWNDNPDERPEASVDVNSSSEDVMRAVALGQKLPTGDAENTEENENEPDTNQPPREAWQT
jgi:hypothetical protein